MENSLAPGSIHGKKSLLPFFGTSICILLLLSACDERTVTALPEPGPPGVPSALIPIAIGNRWTYVDSLLTDSTTAVDTFTVSIENFRTDSMYVWWQFHDTRIPGTYYTELTVRNDSIFSLQYNEDRAVISLEYIPPPEVDTLHYTSIFGGVTPMEKAVYLLEGDCVVPAGVFDSCALYCWADTTLDFVEVIKPGIGIVKAQFHTSAGERRISLLEYSIAQGSSVGP